MKLYFEDKGITLYQADCLEAMRIIPDASIDACITDPPYGTTACSWDAVIPFAPMWVELKRIVKKNGAIVLFGSQPFTSALVMSNPQMFRYVWQWNKKLAGNPFLAKTQPLKVHEDIAVFSREAHVYNPEMKQGRMRQKGGGFSRLFQVACTTARNDDYYPTSILEFSNAERGEHETQKPVDLLRYLVRTYTNEGDRVLDFTCGSGTTGVACVIERRNFIGIEKDSHYSEVSAARIKRAMSVACDIPKRVKRYAPTPLFEQESAFEAVA